MKTRVNLSFGRKVWKAYQKLCEDKDKTPSYEIQRFMEEQVENEK